MTKYIGSRRSSVFTLFSAILLTLSVTSYAATTDLLIVAPGESFTHGAGLSGSPYDQIGGISFNLTVHSYDGGNNLVSTNAYVTFTAQGAYTANFSPSAAYLSQTFDTIPNSGYSPFVTTLTPTSGTADLTFATTTSMGGVNPATKTLHVFRMTQFTFTLPGSWTAGQVYYVTVTARDNANATVTPYNGTVSFRSPNGGVNGANINLGSATFTNGVAYPRIQLLYASSGITLEAYNENPAPGTITSRTSNSFTVSEGAATKLVIMGPGQTAIEGSSGASGRSGTMATQTVGVPFSVTVYACDDYWNRVTSSASITLTATDLGFGGSISPSGWNALSGGLRQYNVNLRRYLSGSQDLTTISQLGGLATDTDNVPLTPGALASLAFSPISSPQTAGVPFWITVTAYDSWGNTVTTTGGVPGNVTFTVSAGGPTFDTTSYTPTTVSGTQFNGDGAWSGSFRVYRQAFSVSLTATAAGISGTSNTFNVNTNTANRYVVVMPGQTYTPGESHNGIWGHSGTPSNVTAGVPVSVSVYVTDSWGNQIAGAVRTITLTLDQPDGNWLPNPHTVTSANGVANFALTLTQAYNGIQNLTASGDGIALPGSSGTFSVVNTALDHFSLNTPTTLTAGNGFTAVITAEDIYGNPVTSFNSPVYVTMPNLDYSLPTQSVIQVNGGLSYYGPTSSTACWRIPGSMFQQPGSFGVCTTTMRVWRSNPSGPTAFLYVSDVDTDTPASHTGHVLNTTTNLTINNNTFARMFTIVPGLQYRAGADPNGNTYFAGSGYVGTVLSQQVNLPFSVTVYATDNYWNPIPTRADQFTASSAPSGYTTFNGQGGTPQFTLIGGLRQLNVSFSANGSYTLTYSVGVGVTPYTTPYTIVAFSIDHFTIRLPNGSAIPTNWRAGVPVTVSITAYDTPSTVATTFNGNANLTYSLDHTTTLQCIRPTNITFTNGAWWGQVTLFRADRFEGQANNIEVEFGSIGSPSDTVHVYPNSSSKMLIVAPGMTAYPGLNPDVSPPEVISGGATGQPDIQTAGTAITTISFFLCDDYWNTVTDTADGALGSITIDCSDPYPARLNGSPFVGGTRTVSLGAQGYPGEYRAVNNFILYKVDGWSGQRIGVSMTGKVPYALDVQKNRVPVKHAATCEAFTWTLGTDARGRNILTQGAIAGVPIATTIAAVDAYGNTMDSINYATPLGTYTSVNLSVNTDPPAGGWSLWPVTTGNMEITRWNEGVSRPWIYLYKKASGIGEKLIATKNFGAGDKTGESVLFNVLPNEYARIVTIVPGMTTPDSIGAGGIYTASYPSTPPPATVAVFNNFGTPSAQTAGVVFNIDAYSCDAYGNMIQYTDDDVTMTNTDRFAPNQWHASSNTYTAVAIDPLNGFAQFTLFKFHTRGTATITVADAEVATITAGTTPSLTVNPGPFFGLQILAPGQVAIEGSGNTNVGASYFPVPLEGWYSGVTPAEPTAYTYPYTARAQLAGMYFQVTVQAVDIYGNFVPTAPNDTIKLTTDANDGSSRPNNSLPAYSALSAGKAYFDVVFGPLDAHAVKSILPTDDTNPNTAPIDHDTPPNGIVGANHSITQVQIAEATETQYEVVVNGIRQSDNVPVYIEAWPSTFTVRVEVRYTGGTHEIVAASSSFLLEPFLNLSTPPTPGTGTLGQRTGLTSYGVATFDINNDPPNPQTYDRSETIFIRARDMNNQAYPMPGYSPEIRVRASTPTRIEMTADTASYTWEDPVTHVREVRYSIEANKDCRVHAIAYDANNNRVTAYPISMVINSPAVTASYLGAPESDISDGNGEVYRTFYAGAQNLRHVLQATAGPATGTLVMNVNVTASGGVYPNPFNPLLGQGVHIDYPLERDANVKVAIYTLLGDLVWHKEFPAGDPDGGHESVNSIIWDGKNDSGVTVANGGYICVIKANDQEKFRFKIGVFKEK